MDTDDEAARALRRCYRSTLADVRRIVATAAITLPDAVACHLARSADTPKPDEIAVDARILATPMMALEAAAAFCRADGVEPLVLGDAIEGESRALGVCGQG